MDTSAEFKFLHYRCGFWEFPKIDDIQIIEVEYIYICPCTPHEITKHGYKFKEDDEALKIFKAFRIKK